MSNLRVKNSEKIITVQNVYCIGKNYLEHIKEFDTKEKAAEVPQEPVIFLKPNTAVNTDPGIVRIPEFNGRKISGDLQNEAELVLVIGKNGEHVGEENAMDYIFGYAAGIDFTLRDIQSECKAKGLPWAVAKGFLFSSPVSEITEKKDIPDPGNLKIQLYVNGALKQDADTSQMIFSINYIVNYISAIFGIREGDLIFTGTPAGITRLNTGDIVECKIEKTGKVSIKVE